MAELQTTKPENIDTLAIDADIVAYRCSAVCENDTVKAVCETIDQFVYNLVNGTGVERLLFCLSGENNFRYTRAIAKPYKGNRTKCKYHLKKGCSHPAVEAEDCLYVKNYQKCPDYLAPIERPRHLETANSYIKELYKGQSRETYEADDLIASFITAYPNAAHAGIDKDIKQVYGWHYDFVKHHWEFTSKDDALLKLYRQVCQGDTSDNIPGLPGIGEKKAAKAILEPSRAKEDAIRLYNEVLIDKDEDQVLEYFEEQFDLIHLVDTIKIPYESYIIVTPPPEFANKSEDGDYDDEAEESKIEL